ncbi:hypothetical protein STRIP9103_07433 [Streptomyces ipomoeae 91-03]|uniref:Uncharacterized protein n=1 Tax=Streptomyces ipomoeae 91-03 TaxID=698759 RepID=L1KJ95_9ACTN|nr:hypothetical protein STRIP9103_07433 [Streptomyces ipomoeae 91-03]
MHLRPHQRRKADDVPCAVTVVGLLLATWLPAPALVAGALLGGVVVAVTRRNP